MGFDFPIGVPAAYARVAGIDDLRASMPELGHGRWRRFYDPAERPDQIGPERPFYPSRPGGARQRHLVDGLGVQGMDALLRRCDRPTPERGAAGSLFWTLGPKQVGKAAISGWRDVLAPALANDERAVAIWPFDGGLAELFEHADVTVVEAYPAEACVQIGLPPPGRGWSKRTPQGRRARAPDVLQWAGVRGVELEAGAIASLGAGFGEGPDGEDPFDALVGVCGMLEVVLGHRPAGTPDDPRVRSVEGWILGLRDPIAAP